MSWFSSHWNKWTSQDPNAAPIRKLQIVWGRETLPVTFPEMVSPPTLSDLKAALSSLTDIPPSNMKLIHKGLAMKDDRQSLASYGLVDGSKVMLVGSNGGPATPAGYQPRKRKGAATGGGQKLGGGEEEFRSGAAEGSGTGHLTPGEEAARKKKLKEEDTSEEGLLSRVEEVRKDARRDLLPKVLQLERSIDALDPTKNSNQTSTQTSTTTAPAPQSTTNNSSSSSATNPNGEDSASNSDLPLVSPSPQLSLLQRGTSEMLLRSLLSLDGIQVQSEATRQARKAAVKEIQSWLDRVDAARERGVKLNWEGKSKV